MANLKLNKHLQEHFCKCLENGYSILEACGSVHICEQTYYNWYNKGKKETSGVFHDFYCAVEIAKNKATANYESVIFKEAMAGNWFASAWWLERRRPKEYRKSKKQTVKAPKEYLR